MKLVCVRLLSDDVPAAVSFWRDVMQLPLSYHDEALGYAYFDAGNGGIEIFDRAGFVAALGASVAITMAGNAGAVLDFEVDDVDARYADLLERGATAIQPPQDRQAWGARTAHVLAPDGYIVELFTRLNTESE